jgi:hypothetical protein
VLNGKLELHGVEDVEQLCVKVLNGWERRTHTRLNPADREDAIAYLVATAWEIASFHFDPGKGVRFEQHLHSILSFRVVDWLRQDEGRTKWTFATHEHVRERPIVLSLDAPAGPGGSGPSDDGVVGTLGDRLPVVDGGAEGGVRVDSAAVVGRLLGFRRRERARLRALADSFLSSEVAA